MASTISMDGSVATVEAEDAKDTVGNLRDQLVKQKSMTMEYFIESRNLDKQTSKLMMQYDKDGNGEFDHNEVAAIVLDLREAVKAGEELREYNVLFKRLLLGAIVFSVILLSAMFGLSFAVAELTRITDVHDNGVMYNKDGNVIIATDSVANTVTVGKDTNGDYCMSTTEAIQMQGDALSGHNVLLQSEDGEEAYLQKLSVTGSSIQDDRVCFYASDLNRTACIVYVNDNCDLASGRRLDEVDRSCCSLFTNQASYNACMAWENGCPSSASVVVSAGIIFSDED